MLFQINYAAIITIVYVFLAGLVYFCYRTQIELLGKKFKYLFVGTWVVLPIVEALTLVNYAYDVLAFSWSYLNILEHAMFAFAMVLLLSAVLAQHIRDLPMVALSAVFGSVSVVGVINELVEYMIRGIAGASQFATNVYYTDTVKDLSINLVGAAIGVAVVWLVSREEGAEMQKSR